jgi:polyisoprenoid-binding protein YceI
MKRLPILLTVLIVGTIVLAACGASEAAAPAPTNTPLPPAPAAEEETASEPEEAAVESEEAAEAESGTEEETVSEEQASETEAVTEPEAPAAEETAESVTEGDSEESAAEMEVEADSGTESEEAPAEEAPEAASAVRTFVIMPEQSKASYIVAEEFFGGALDRLGIQPGLVDTIGSTQEVNGEMQLNLSDPSSPLVSSQFEVNIRSLTSDQSRRDNIIRDRWLESNTYPSAQFTITSLENVPGSFNEGEEVTFKANGDITVRDITQPASFDVTAKLEGDTITGVATTELKMTDFGFDPPNFANVFSVANEFTAQVEFTFEEQ